MAVKIKFDIRHILLLGLMTMPVIAFVQSKWIFFKKMELKGDVTIANAIPFSLPQWFSGDYQTSMEKHLNDTYGFRNLSVRLNNQLEYSLFKKINAEDVVMGKNNYLFVHNYIRAYYGLDFIGEDKIRERSERIKFIQDTLAKLNKTLIIVFAPGKASFFPEYIPDSCRRPIGETNNNFYVKEANSLGINYIDFKRYFIENKYKSKYPLYPQYGVHWSYYGTCLATDSLIKYIEYKRHINMPHIYWNQIDVKNNLAFYDYDVADGMNLLFRFKCNNMAYPRVQFQPAAGKTKPSVLVVGDSHYFGMTSLGISHAFSNSSAFWYYNREVYNDSTQGTEPVSQLNLKNEIAKHDVFIIVSTESTISDIGWGFIENVYNFFKGFDARIPYYNEKLAEKTAYIKTDENWMDEIRIKSQKKGISIDAMVILDAQWAVQNEYTKKINNQRAYIKTDPHWMKNIQIKAAERKLSVDSMITLDAMWVTDNAEWDAKQERMKKIASLRKTIMSTPDWMDQIRKKAQERHLTIDSMITLDAIWAADNPKEKQTQDYMGKVANMRNTIKSNPEWMAQIRKKAEKRHLSIDSMISLDAIWALGHPGK